MMKNIRSSCWLSNIFTKAETFELKSKRAAHINVLRNYYPLWGADGHY